jgi:hypothetical protein
MPAAITNQALWAPMAMSNQKMTHAEQQMNHPTNLVRQNCRLPLGGRASTAPSQRRPCRHYARSQTSPWPAMSEHPLTPTRDQSTASLCEGSKSSIT